MSAAVPDTRYVRSGGIHIAYQLVGNGPVDVVFASEWWLHLDAQWEDPLVGRFPRRLASFCRVLLFDRRGFGLSDPLPADRPPTVEDTMHDALVLMDEVGFSRAAILAAGDAGPLGILLAASHPDRIDRLVLFNAFARLARA